MASLRSRHGAHGITRSQRILRRRHLERGTSARITRMSRVHRTRRSSGLFQLVSSGRSVKQNLATCSSLALPLGRRVCSLTEVGIERVAQKRSIGRTGGRAGSGKRRVWQDIEAVHSGLHRSKAQGGGERRGKGPGTRLAGSAECTRRSPIPPYMIYMYTRHRSHTRCHPPWHQMREPRRDLRERGKRRREQRTRSGAPTMRKKSRGLWPWAMALSVPVFFRVAYACLRASAAASMPAPG